MITQVLIETLKRVAEIAVIIFPVLFLVEYANHKFGDKLMVFLEKRKRALPFWAGLLSILPGCNAAAAIAVLYTKGMVSIGALVAAIIATSDEAIYVFIPNGFNFLPLFAVKLIFAICVGMLIDLFLGTKMLKRAKEAISVDYCCSIHHEHDHKVRGMIKHTFQHGIKIIGFVFLVLFVFNHLQDSLGIDKLGSYIASTGAFQPFLAGLFGLIPGCGTSVVLATLYTKGILTFGGALAGLSTASGDAILVLISNKVGYKKVAIILGTVFVLSVLAGYLINWII